MRAPVALLILLTAARASAAPEALPRTLSPLLVHPPKKSEATVVRASARFDRPVDPKILHALELAGARPVRLGGLDTLAVVGSVVSIDVPREKLLGVARLPHLVRLEPAAPLVRLRPLDVTAETIGAPSIWSPPTSATTAGTRGEGVVVADHESGWSIFHPDLFFPDGGSYDFVDEDGDGVAGPGDSVLMPCAEGTCPKRLSLLDGTRYDMYTSETDTEPGYQPSLDWLYVDLNGDGERSAGHTAGFDEDAPALGEPIFVGDDVDQSGHLEVGEHLVLLSTPKVRAIWNGIHTYRRGVDLSRWTDANDPFHGTGATGIVVSGWPGLRRYTGIAPGAELVLVETDDPVAGLAAATDLGARVNMFEWDSPIEFQDGSSNFEVAVSELSASGRAVQVAAVGNLAGSDHCMKVALLPNTSALERFSTSGDGVWQYQSFWLDLTWRAAPSAVRVTLVAPSGATFTPSGAYSERALDGVQVGAWLQTSPRGTTFLMLQGTPASGSVIPELELAVRLETSSTAAEVRGLLFDDQSGWARGVAWLDDITDEGTALMPSTADHVIGVAAFGGEHDLSDYGWGVVGERRAYSGLGPRIDGARVVDLSAPDDPFTPTDPSHGLYTSFGGTSGALPHVTGAAALMLAVHPAYTADDVERALFSTAIADRFTGAVPNEGYGHGKIRVDRALELVRATGAPPSLHLAAPDQALVGTTATVTAEVGAPDPASVLVAWDLDYDGALDGPPGAERTRTVTSTRPASRSVVAQAIDPTGRTSRAIASVTFVEPCDVAGCTRGCCSAATRLCEVCAPDASVPDASGADVAMPDATADAGLPDAALASAPGPSCDCTTTSASAGGPFALLLFVALVRKRSAQRDEGERRSRGTTGACRRGRRSRP